MQNEKGETTCAVNVPYLAICFSIKVAEDLRLRSTQTQVREMESSFYVWLLSTSFSWC